MTEITMATYQLVVAALLKGTEVVVEAKQEWNGFVPDVKYILSIEGGRVSAVDQHGLTSVIDQSDAADYFNLITKLAPEEVAPAIPLHTRLAAACASLTEDEHDFKVGELIVWKDGISNRYSPKYGEPVVVTKVYAVPVRDESATTDSMYFDEPLSLKVGVINETPQGSKFFEIAVDGRRFRLYDPAVDGEYSPVPAPQPGNFFIQALGRGLRNSDSEI